MRKVEYKPLSFSTTMRNPERIAMFVSCIKEFANQKLTSEVIMQIVSKILLKKLYKPMGITRNTELNSIYNDENRVFTDAQIKEIIKNNPQNHKEAGFPKGWESRFDTWFKLCKEFGFVYYEMDKPIEISVSGYELCNAYNDEEDDNSGEKIQNIFLNALMKYQTNNPFRRTANDNAPVPLLLNTLKLLKEDKDENGAGIYRKELSFLICWNDSNHNEFYNYIKNFRKEYGYKASDEIIYDKCLELLHSDNTKRFKMSQITKEAIDDLIRKLRITGVFSLRGMGRFIDINTLEQEKIDYIIDNYTDYSDFEDEYEFYSYMGKVDSNIVSVVKDKVIDISDIRIKALSKFASEYEYGSLAKELENLQFNKPSKDEFLRLIDSPTRLEFLTSIILYKQYPNYDIKPNYAIDDEGIPTFTAKGGIGDIEVYASDLDSLVEVTLMRNKQQATNEIPAITRHLKELKNSSEKQLVFSLFIAPMIHPDTTYMCGFTKYQEKLDIYPYTICEFVEKIKNTRSLVDLTSIS